MDKLKPCPFCGCEMNIAKDGSLIAWHSLKPICFFLLLEEVELDMEQEEIHKSFATAWNRRTDNA